MPSPIIINSTKDNRHEKQHSDPKRRWEDRVQQELYQCTAHTYLSFHVKYNYVGFLKFQRIPGFDHSE
uniref:Ovule protein n=1 Tax=Heterorhabditis bacteriophora TaxID=37862 RepID=A0A1I7X3R0_HETBA